MWIECVHAYRLILIKYIVLWSLIGFLVFVSDEYASFEFNIHPIRRTLPTSQYYVRVLSSWNRSGRRPRVWYCTVCVYTGAASRAFSGCLRGFYFQINRDGKILICQRTVCSWKTKTRRVKKTPMTIRPRRTVSSFSVYIRRVCDLLTSVQCIEFANCCRLIQKKNPRLRSVW